MTFSAKWCELFAVLGIDEFVTNRSWSTDDLLDWLDCHLDDETQVITDTGIETGIYYDDLYNNR